MFVTRVREADVLQTIRGNPLLGASLRQAALTLAEQYPQDPQTLNRESWAVVGGPEASADAHRRALLQAEEACRLAPQHGPFLTTLGVAQYRMGLYQTAVETLARSEKLNSTRANGPSPADLAFLAMPQHRLGNKEHTQSTLARLREAFTNPRWADTSPVLGFSAGLVTVGLLGSPLGQVPLLAASGLITGRPHATEHAAFLPEATTLIEAPPPTKR